MKKLLREITLTLYINFFNLAETQTREHKHKMF